MSEQTHPQVKTPPKGKGLGRGLGSLLGSTDEGAFSKTVAPATKAVEELTAKIEAKAEPAIREGIIESPSPVTAVAPPVPAAAPVAPVVPDHLRIWHIPIEKLNPNPKQPRQNFTKESLDELAASIREKGVIQPILARKVYDDEFEIIAGERRWRAAQLAGLKEVPTVLKQSEDQEVLEIALIENIQRENLNPIEEAEAYDYLIKKYNLTQADLAQKVGKERATVTNVLRILQLEPSVRQMVSKGEISLGQAKVLLGVSDTKLQNTLAQKARQESLSVRALEKLVAKSKLEADEPAMKRADARLKAAEQLGEELQKLIGSKVTLDYDNGKGRIVIHFYSDDELNQMTDTLRDSWRS
jgi:ParB family chromosome partitioning protein